MEPDTTPQDDQASEETTHKPLSNKRTGLLVLGIALIAFLLRAMLVTRGNEQKTSSGTTVASAQKFPNQLTPTSELKVGDARYVSPCQVFPMSAAEQFGKVDASTYVADSTLPASRPQTDAASENRVETKCSYYLAGNSSVSLHADQYADPTELKQLPLIYLRSASEQDAILSGLKQRLGGSNDPDAKALVATIEKSLVTFKKYQKVYDPEQVKNVNFNGMLLPAYASNNLQLLYGNVVYELETNVDIKKATVSQMASLNRAYSDIKKRAADSHLDQSPAPTILGTKDHIVSTKILEPCVISSSDTFKTLTGQADNDVVDRLTLPVDPSRDIVDQKVNKHILFSNECKRTFNGGDAGTSIGLTLYHGRSVPSAAQFFKDYQDDPESTVVAIQTAADETMSLSGLVLGEPTTDYLFRVGPYVAVMQYQTTDRSSGDTKFAPVPQDKAVAAINLFVEQIKKQQ